MKSQSLDLRRWLLYALGPLRDAITSERGLNDERADSNNGAY